MTDTRKPTVPLLEVRIAGNSDVAEFAEPFRIGRAADNDVVVEDTSVSQYHAEVVPEDGAWLVRDLGSTNGVIVGGRRVDQHRIDGATAIRLGVDGPTLVLYPPGSGRRTVEAGAEDATEAEIAERYFGNRPTEQMGRHTRMVRQAFKREQERRVQKYAFLLLILAVLVAGAGGYAFIKHQQVEQQRAITADLFYAMKTLDLQVASLPLDDDQRQQYRAQRANLEQRYLDNLEELGVYSEATPEAVRLVYRVVHRLGESEVNVPKAFVDEVQRYLERWKRTPQLAEAITRAEAAGYGRRVTEIMLAHDLPPEFLYLALQESNFKLDAVGPQTRFGIAKGMWQLIPGTAREYGLQTGPLVGVRRFDPRDERHDFEMATRAAAEYLRDIYTTDAQASGLLVIASYNWGQTRVLRLIRTLPENPRERNYWNILTKYRDNIPDETYDYVLRIVSAAVIGENPALFGFDFAAPLRHRDEIVESIAAPPTTGP